MALEKETETDPQEPCREKLPPGHKLLLASLTSIVGFGMKGESVNDAFAKFEPNLDTIEELAIEYVSVFSLLTFLVGRENLIVAKTKLTTGKSLPNGAIKLEFTEMPEPPEIGSVEIPFLSEFFLTWPRDAHTLINGKVLGNPGAWKIQGEGIQPSSLGEGGKVLQKGKALLVTPDIWRTSRRGEIPFLRNIGFQVGCLPFVDSSKQQFEFKEDHIDGHASLIEDKKGKLVLVVAESYSHQGAGTRKLIRQAADSVGAKIVEIHDKNLPPLAFNFIQFDDRSIALTHSEAKDLELTLALLVGKDRVFTTEIPLTQIPKLGYGGIRCLTNIIPPLLTPRLASGRA